MKRLSISDAYGRQAVVGCPFTLTVRGCNLWGGVSFTGKQKNAPIKGARRLACLFGCFCRLAFYIGGIFGLYGL